MRIAVTYENGEVFGHFGHTEQLGRKLSAIIVDTCLKLFSYLLTKRAMPAIIVSVG